MNSEQLVKDEISIVKYTDPNYTGEAHIAKDMPKLIRDGKVAVLYSPRHGAGWYTWHGVEELIYDPVLVEKVEAYRAIENPTPEHVFDFNQDAERYCDERYKNKYFGGAEDLQIMWLPVGTRFRITEYDGYEDVEIPEEVNWMVA